MTREDLAVAEADIAKLEAANAQLLEIRDKVQADIDANAKWLRSAKRKLGKARSLLKFIETHERKGATS